MMMVTKFIMPGNSLTKMALAALPKAILGLRLDPKRPPRAFQKFSTFTTNERYFPDAATVAAGNGSDPFQALPTTNRDINIAFSVRDNKQPVVVSPMKKC